MRLYLAVFLAGSLCGTLCAWADRAAMVLPGWQDPRVGMLFQLEVLRPPPHFPESVLATAFCSCPLCTGKWAAFGLTASGKPPVEGLTIAADWRMFPRGACLNLAGVGKRLVQDTGSKIKGARVDVYFDSHTKALEFGVRRVGVKPC